MLPCLLMGVVLSTAQVPPPDPEPPAPEAAPSVPAAPPLPPPPTPSPPAPARWFLMKALQGTWEGDLLDGNRLAISGWTQTSYTGSSNRRVNLPLGFNYRANEFLLQQNWLRFERTVVTAGTTEPTFGFRSDWILPGSDYRFTVARGLFDSQLTAHHGRPVTYGIDPIQFYGEACFPTIGQGLDIKIGRFFAIYGVESNAAVDNVLWSHAYTMLYNPFTQTGVLGTLKLNAAWTVQAAMTTGSDIFIDPAAKPTFAGNVRWAPPTGRDSVQFAVIVGPGRFDQPRQVHNPELFDLIYFHQFNPRLGYTMETLYGFTTNVPDTGFANWLGHLHYVSYAFSPRLSANSRVELFDDFQGQRTGFAGLYSALTLGLNFQPSKAVILRPEIRYDRNWQSRPFEDKHDLVTVGSDLILRW